jgi:hypothetical protein
MATKRKYKKKALPVRLGECATKERCRKNGGIKVEVVERDARGRPIIMRQCAIAECTLDIYYLRETITDAQYTAGMKFRKAYLRAVLGVKVSDIGGGACGDPDMAIVVTIFSEQLVRQAYDRLSLEDLTVVVAVCGHDEWAGGVFRFRHLLSGLDTLAKKWGIA